MSAYEALAFSYDSLTQDIPYEDMLTYMEALLRRHDVRPQSVLDLACGTGSMSVLLAKKGYQVIGADLSEDMLAMAWEKASELNEPPFFICQSMQALQLPYPVDWVACCLDSLNYVTDPADCREAIWRVFDSLAPGGVFIFDINSEEKLRGLDGQVFLDENEDTYCVWRAEFDQEENICYYGMDIFQLTEQELWERSFEEHREYAYTVEQLTSWLREAGFVTVEVYGDRSFDAPQKGEQRIYFYAQKG